MAGRSHLLLPLVLVLLALLLLLLAALDLVGQAARLVHGVFDGLAHVPFRVLHRTLRALLVLLLTTHTDTETSTDEKQGVRCGHGRRLTLAVCALVPIFSAIFSLACCTARCGPPTNPPTTPHRPQQTSAMAHVPRPWPACCLSLTWLSFSTVSQLSPAFFFVSCHKSDNLNFHFFSQPARPSKAKVLDQPADLGQVLGVLRGLLGVLRDLLRRLLGLLLGAHRVVLGPRRIALWHPPPHLLQSERTTAMRIQWSVSGLPTPAVALAACAAWSLTEPMRSFSSPALPFAASTYS